MRAGPTCLLLALGVVAFAGSGCDQLGPWWEAVPRDKGNGGAGTGTGGASGAPSMCVRITEGGSGTCEDYATYKIRSADVCAQKNLVISSLESGASCGTGGVESMTFVCCPPAPPTPVTCSESTDANGRACKTCVDANGKTVSSDCNSNVPGMMCVKIDGGGDATSCKPYDLWKQYGADTCQQKNMQLTELVTGPSCGGMNYQNATYVCCATIPSGATGTGGSPGAGSGGTGCAAGPMCTTNRISTGTGCKSYDLWKQDASTTCTQTMRQLTSITPGPACDGGIVGVTFTCCDAPTQSPPKCTQTMDASGQVCKTCVDSATGAVISNECVPGPGSSACVTIDDGGPTSCKDEATWKRYGTSRCAQQNLILRDLKLAVACPGAYSMVTYVCCGAEAP